jgi:hypothetical protein
VPKLDVMTFQRGCQRSQGAKYKYSWACAVDALAMGP